MISAKNSLFRQQIRRRQIDQKLRTRRIELLRKEEQSRTFDENEQILNEGRSILHNLKYHNDEKNDFERLQSLSAFKKHFYKFNRNMLLKLVTQNPYLVNLFSEVLEGVNKSKLEWHNKSPCFQLVIKMLAHVIELQEVTDKCIMQSRIIEGLIPYLLQYNHKHKILQCLFNFLSNATSKSQSLSNYYTRLQIPSILIKLMVSMRPNAQDKYLANFMYFLRTYIQLMANVEFNEFQTSSIISAALSVSRSAINANVKTQQVYVTLADSLVVLKQFFNRGKIQINHPQIDAQVYLEIISQKNYPFEVKRQALFIIDHIICFDDQNQITSQLVFDKALVTRLWSVHEDLRYIVINTLSNLVLNPNYKKSFADLIYAIRMKLKFQSESESTYKFIYNYFYSQNYFILTNSDQNMVQMLGQLRNNNVETIKLQANIWYGLVKANPDLRPPMKITSNTMIPQVNDLVNMIRNQEHQFEYQRQQEG